VLDMRKGVWSCEFAEQRRFRVSGESAKFLLRCFNLILVLITCIFMLQEGNAYVYCPKCSGKAWSGWDENVVISAHPNHEGKSIDYPGIFIVVILLCQVNIKT
jgi:hypothetical protein